jgi:anthranilate synthase component 2
MLLLIDNYDSFTYNLAQYLAELGAEVRVVRNDAITVEEALAMHPSHLVLSPGPGRPEAAGITLPLIARLGLTIPTLGVCLGHQAIAMAFGGEVVEAREVMHGKSSPIQHTGQGLFARLPSPFAAARYHSLVVRQSSLPAELEVTAWTTTASGATDEIMGLRHRHLPILGVQFHPESILTQHGHQLLANFLGDQALRQVG